MSDTAFGFPGITVEHWTTEQTGSGSSPLTGETFYLRLRQMEETLNQLRYFLKIPMLNLNMYVRISLLLLYESNVGDFITNKLVSDITPKNIDEQN